MAQCHFYLNIHKLKCYIYSHIYPSLFPARKNSVPHFQFGSFRFDGPKGNVLGNSKTTLGHLGDKK